MKKAPKSYIDQKRPPLREAILAEGNMTIEEALTALARKGYFTARPRPWKLGFHDRGLDRSDFAVLDRFGDLIAVTPQIADAALIVAAVNAYKK